MSVLNISKKVDIKRMIFCGTQGESVCMSSYLGIHEMAGRNPLKLADFLYNRVAGNAIGRLIFTKPCKTMLEPPGVLPEPRRQVGASQSLAESPRAPRN